MNKSSLVPTIPMKVPVVLILNFYVQFCSNQRTLGPILPKCTSNDVMGSETRDYIKFIKLE